MAKEYDPQMHSAEHILNRTMVQMFGCGRSFSSHLNAGKSKCDYHFDRDLTEAEVSELQNRINAQIARSLSVTAEMTDWDKAAELVDVSRLPESARGEKLRLVYVGDYDICACIGEHIQNTSEIGEFRIISHSFTPSGPSVAEPLAIEPSAAEPSATAAPDSPEGKTGVLRLRFRLG